jgi:hypothetical protein
MEKESEERLQEDKKMDKRHYRIEWRKLIDGREKH